MFAAVSAEGSGSDAVGQVTAEGGMRSFNPAQRVADAPGHAGSRLLGGIPETPRTAAQTECRSKGLHQLVHLGARRFCPTANWSIGSGA
jgi:hypothetical protein